MARAGATLLLGLAGALLLPAAAPARAHDVSGEISALEEHIKDLQVNEMVLRSDIRETGGSATAHIGIAGAEARIRHDQMQIQTLEGILPLYGQSVEEMRELARQYRADSMPSISDVAEEGAEQIRDKGIEKGLVKVGAQFAGKTFGVVGLVGDIVEIGGKMVFRIQDASRLRQEATAQQLQLNKVLEAITQFQREIQREHQRIAQLRGLEEQFHVNLDDLATSKARLQELQAHRHADTTRVTDAAGDAALAAESLVGRWTMQQMVQVHGKSAPMGPPTRVEIARGTASTARDAPPRYEVFGPDKATARNGPLMRCTRDGYQLNCQRRVQQQACPPGKYVWAPLQLTMAADASTLTGEMRQTWLMDPRSDPSGCTMVAGEGMGTIGFRFVPDTSTRLRR